MLEVQCDKCNSEKLLLEFYIFLVLSPGTPPSANIEDPRKIPSWQKHREGNSTTNTVTYAQRVFHSKGLLSRGRDFIRAFSQLRKTLLPSDYSNLPVAPKWDKELCKVLDYAQSRERGPLKG